MGVEEALCMKGGSGETSYAKNSVLQRTIIGKMGPMLEESIRAILSATSSPPECLTIADLGCSTGPNTLAVLQSIMDVSVATCRSSGLRVPEFNVLMNDLPQNDFKTVFMSLSSFHKKMEEEHKGVETSCFISGTSGSFYSRLFPTKSVHFMHSSTCLHFVSQVPEGLEDSNKGSAYARKGSPPEVLQAYKERFGKDLASFLKCRSNEIVDGGRLLLSICCTYDDEPYPSLEVLNQAMIQLTSQGKIDKKKFDSFNMPLYLPTIQQVKQLIEAEGSFILHKDDTFIVSIAGAIRSRNVDDNVDIGQAITNTVRAGVESMLVSEFGEETVDTLFCLTGEIVNDAFANGEDFEILSLALSLIKKD